MVRSSANKHYNPKLDPDSPDYIGGGAGTTPGADIGGMLSTATITRYDTYGRVATEQTFGHDLERREDFMIRIRGSWA